MSKLKGNRCYTKMEGKKYPIGAWIPPLPECMADQEETNARYAEAKAAGINLINATFEYITPGALERCLEAARVNGQKVMIGMPHENEETCLSLVRATKQHPVVIGYTLKDEPTAEHFEQLGRLRDKIRAEVEDSMFVMCNMLPSYFTMWDDQPNPETGLTVYQKYIRDYMEIVRPDCLSLDHYPLGSDPKDDISLLRCFLKNLTDIRNIGAEYGVETWGFIQSSGWQGRREPNENELRFVINMHLVFGFKQLSYFLYWQPWEEGLKKDGYDYSAMITYQGEQTEIYRRGCRIAHDWLSMGSTYLDYDNEGFILSNLDPLLVQAMDQAPVAEAFGAVAAIESEYPLFTGYFRDGKEKEGLFIVNFDYSHNTTAEAVVQLQCTKSIKVWGRGGLEQACDGDALRVELAPGQAKFIELI